MEAGGGREAQAGRRCAAAGGCGGRPGACRLRRQLPAPFLPPRPAGPPCCTKSNLQNRYCIYCSGADINICLAAGEAAQCLATSASGKEILQVPCAQLPNSGVLQGGCPTAVQGYALKSAGLEYWPTSKATCP